MKRILATTIALLLTARAFAVTDTWDGGSTVGPSLNLDLNWLDDSAPVSDIVNTDLLFAGVVSLIPNVSVAFSTHSIGFTNTAGAFIIGGQPLSIGMGGITNSDTQTMTFNNLVNFGDVGRSDIDADNGGLVFNNTVTLPTGSLFVGGPVRRPSRTFPARAGSSRTARAR